VFAQPFSSSIALARPDRHYQALPFFVRHTRWSRIPAILAEESSVSQRFHRENAHIFLHSK
jgi:hypothetical protein